MPPCRRQAAQEVYDRQGKLIIPSFAVGRTQELAYRLYQLWEEDQLPPIDAYVDSPLAVNVTEVFRLHPECYNEEMLDAMAFALHELRLVLEPSGACALALARREARGRCGVLLSGGNVDPGRLAEVAAAEAPA